MLMKYLIFFPILFFSMLLAQAQEDVNLFDYWKFYSDAQNCMYKTSCDLAFEQLDQRKAEIARLKTPGDYQARQALVKKKLNRIIGPMPEKTPLNARVTGVIKKKDYRVEKVGLRINSRLLRYCSAISPGSPEREASCRHLRQRSYDGRFSQSHLSAYNH